MNDKIIDKIRKLLALGENNPNQIEAEAAILKAQALMAEHDIHSVSTDEQISYSKEFCVHQGNRKFRRLIANVIAPNFKCRYYLNNGKVVFFGRATDAKIAKEVFEYAYSYAYKESNHLYNEARKRGYASNGVVNSYALGFVRGLKEKLDAQSVALMVITPPDVQTEYDALCEQEGMRKSHFKVTVSRTDATAYNQGLADGRTVMNGRRLESA